MCHCVKSTLGIAKKVFFLFLCLAVVQLYEYIVEVEIHVSDDAQIVQLRHALENISFPVRLSNTVNITQIDIIFTGKNL